MQARPRVPGELQLLLLETAAGEPPTTREWSHPRQDECAYACHGHARAHPLSIPLDRTRCCLFVLTSGFFPCFLTMARRGRRRSGRGSDDSDGGGSTATVSTVSAAGGDGDGDASDGEAHDGSYAAEVESLCDKRRWVRDDALTRLTARLCAGVPSAALELRSVGEELADGLLRHSLKRGDTAEAAAAARVLGLLVLTLADGDDSGPAAAAAVATRAAEALLFRGRYASCAAPGAAAEAAALCLFLASDDVTETDEALGALERALTPAGVRTNKAAAAPAARAWTLLASTLRPAALVSRVSRGSYVRVAPGSPRTGPPPMSVAASLRKLATQVVDGDARLAAAQALGLILEVRAEGEDSDDDSDPAGDAPWGGDTTDEDDADGGVGGGRPHRSEAAKASAAAAAAAAAAARAARRQAEADSMGLVAAALADVALESTTTGSRVPKSQRAGRRALAAAATAGVDGRGGEADVVTLGDGEVVGAETVGDRRRLDAFRRLLGSGLRPHLEANSVVRAVFDLPPSVTTFVEEAEGGGGDRSARSLGKSARASGRAAAGKERQMNISRRRVTRDRQRTGMGDDDG